MYFPIFHDIYFPDIYLLEIGVITAYAVKCG